MHLLSSGIMKESARKPNGLVDASKIRGRGCRVQLKIGVGVISNGDILFAREAVVSDKTIKKNKKNLKKLKDRPMKKPVRQRQELKIEHPERLLTSLRTTYSQHPTPI
jgi:hypothetical protein